MSQSTFSHIRQLILFAAIVILTVFVTQTNAAYPINRSITPGGTGSVEWDWPKPHVLRFVL